MPEHNCLTKSQDYTNNLRGDNNFNIAMNRMKAADITLLRYLFDMYLLCLCVCVSFLIFRFV